MRRCLQTALGLLGCGFVALDLSGFNLWAVGLALLFYALCRERQSTGNRTPGGSVGAVWGIETSTYIYIYIVNMYMVNMYMD